LRSRPRETLRAPTQIARPWRGERLDGHWCHRGSWGRRPAPSRERGHGARRGEAPRCVVTRSAGFRRLVAAPVAGAMVARSGARRPTPVHHQAPAFVKERDRAPGAAALQAPGKARSCCRWPFRTPSRSLGLKARPQPPGWTGSDAPPTQARLPPALPSACTTTPAPVWDTPKLAGPFWPGGAVDTASGTLSTTLWPE